MEINYTNTESELIEFATYVRLNSSDFRRELKVTRNTYLIMAAVVGLWGLFNLYLYFTSKDPSRLSSALSMGFVGLITIGFIFLARKLQTHFTKRAVRKEIEKNEGRAHPMEVRIDAKNLSWNSESGKGSCRLTEEISVAETEQCYFLQTRKHALIIPKRALEDKEEQFRKMMNVEARMGKPEQARGK